MGQAEPLRQELCKNTDSWVPPLMTVTWQALVGSENRPSVHPGELGRFGNYNHRAIVSVGRVDGVREYDFTRATVGVFVSVLCFSFPPSFILFHLNP
jgi:hypothetical protein